MLVLPVPSIDAVTNFLDDQQRRAAMMTDCAPADGTSPYLIMHACRSNTGRC
jgi:hypothetical protein